MPVQIGGKTHSFREPTGLLSDCHRRIEMFLGSLVRVAQLVEKPLDADARTAMETSLHYFREAAPKHTADEEESLFQKGTTFAVHGEVSERMYSARCAVFASVDARGVTRLRSGKFRRC